MSAEETQISQPEAPVAEPTPTPAPAPAPTPAPELPPTTDRRELLTRAVEKSTERGKHAQHQPRTPHGQFNGPPKAPEVPAVPAIPRPQMPKSLKRELQPHWETAHPELAAAIHQRELDYEKGLTPLQRAKAEYEELINEFKPYEQIMRSQNATPKQVIANLMKTASILHTGSPVDKAMAVAQTMRQFGISFEQVQQLLSGSGAPAALGNGAPAIDPRVSELEQRYQTLESQLQQQANSQVEAAVEKFLGNPENKYANDVWEQMVPLLKSPEVLGDARTIEDKLKAAYQKAIRLNDDVFARVQADQKAKEQSEQQIAQARQAAVQVSGAPTAGPAPELNPKDRRAFLANQFSTQR